MRRQDAPGFLIGQQQIIERANGRRRIAIPAAHFNGFCGSGKLTSADIGGRSLDRMRSPRSFRAVAYFKLKSQLCGKFVG